MKTEINNIHQRVIFVVVLWQSLSVYFIVVNHYLSGYGFHHKIYRQPERPQKRTFSTCLGILLCRPPRDLWWQVYAPA